MLSQLKSPSRALLDLYGFYMCFFSFQFLTAVYELHRSSTQVLCHFLAFYQGHSFDTFIWLVPSHYSIIRDSCQDGFILPCPSHFFSGAACCCIRKVFLERHNTHVYSFQIWSPWETKVLTPSKSNLVSFIRVMNRSKNDSKTVVSLKCTPGQVAALYSWEPGTCCTPCRQLCCCKEGLLVHLGHLASLDLK